MRYAAIVICEYDGSGVSSDADCVSVINGETQDILEQYLPQLLGGKGRGSTMRTGLRN